MKKYRRAIVLALVSLPFMGALVLWRMTIDVSHSSTAPTESWPRGVIRGSPSMGWTSTMTVITTQSGKDQAIWATVAKQKQEGFRLTGQNTEQLLNGKFKTTVTMRKDPSSPK